MPLDLQDSLKSHSVARVSSEDSLNDLSAVDGVTRQPARDGSQLEEPL